MPMLIGIVWGFALAHAAGGRLAGVDDAELKRLWFVIPLFVVQGFARGRLGTRAFELGLLLWAVAGVLVCAYVLWKVSDSGLRLIGLGFAANLLVVLLNGHMPFSLDSTLTGQELATAVTSSGFYGIAGASTILGFLGDVLPLALFGHRYLLSVGDVLLVVGATAYLWGVMVVSPSSRVN